MDKEIRIDRGEEENRMKEWDKTTPSPELRAQKVYDILTKHKPRPTLWDLVCFSCQVLTISVEHYPYLKTAAIAVNHLIYSAHYKINQTYDSFIDAEGKEIEK